MRGTRLRVTVALVATALTGCAPVAAEPAPAPSVPPAAAAAPTAAADLATIATARTDVVEVFAAPDDPAPARVVAAADVLSVPDGTPLTFLAAEVGDGWVRVHLPVRPSGSTGWVRAADVELSTTADRVQVGVGEHRLRVLRAGEVVLDVPVGVGRAELPTPGGVYYLKELLATPDPDGLYGPYAFGLSGYSPVLDSFAGGDAVIGIHGTDDPASIGTDVSHGCIRLHNADVVALVDLGLALGTPVEILP